MRTATSSIALAVFAQAEQALTAGLKQVVQCLAEAEDYLNRSEPGETSSMLHHVLGELRIRVAALDTPLVSALRRLGMNGKHVAQPELHDD